MRVVISDIEGEDLAKLYLFLRTVEFGNKEELFNLMNNWSKEIIERAKK